MMEDDFLRLNSNNVDLTSGGRRAERRDAAENRQRILQVAKQLFAEQGVADVHMAQIAEAAGVGKGTLYRRFANKSELCLALMHDQLVEHQDAVLARLHLMQLQGTSYVERVKDFLAEVAIFTEKHVPLLCEAQSSGLVQGMEGDAPFFQWQQMTVQGLLQAAMWSGELRTDVDLPITVDFLLAPLTAPYFRYLHEVRRFSTEQIGQALCDAVDRLTVASGQ